MTSPTVSSTYNEVASSTYSEYLEQNATKYQEKLNRIKEQRQATLAKSYTAILKKTAELFAGNKKLEPRFCEPCQRYVNNMAMHKTTQMHAINTNPEPCPHCSTETEQVMADVRHLRSDYHKTRCPTKTYKRLVG